MAVGNWGTTILCTDADCVKLEPDFLRLIERDGGGKQWRELAKERIADRLHENFINLDRATDEAEVLDLIANPTELKTAAVLKTLELVFEAKSGLSQHYQRKADRYLSLFEDELPRAVRRLNVDLDESGTIDETEERNVSMDVRFRLGG